MDYVSLTGTKPGRIKTRDFGPLSPCYFHFVKLVAPQDSTEQLRHYITTNMVLNIDKDVTIKMGAGRVIEMNNTLPYLPCLKYKEGVPTVMSAMNTKYTEIELCTTVLNAANLTVLTAYYDAVHNEFPTYITRFTAQLTRVCNQNTEHKILLNDLDSRMGLNANDCTGNRTSMNIATDAIPHKTRDRKHRGGPPVAANSTTLGGNTNNDTKGGGCAL